jgi:hypothetical protein
VANLQRVGLEVGVSEPGIFEAEDFEEFTVQFPSRVRHFRIRIPEWLHRGGRRRHRGHGVRPGRELGAGRGEESEGDTKAVGIGDAGVIEHIGGILEPIGRGFAFKLVLEDGAELAEVRESEGELKSNRGIRSGHPE